MLKDRWVFLTGVILIISLFGYSRLLASHKVRAATDSATLAIPEAISQKATIDSEIEKLQMTYRGQLQEYRNLEREFSIKKNQFENLGTLTALESAIQATRQVLFKRAQVLDTYTELLRLHLLNAEGINLEQKEYALEGVITQNTKIKAHAESVQQADDRQGVETVANEFASMVELYQFSTEYSRMVLLIARLQNFYDQSVALHTQLLERKPQLNALRQSERERALDQIGQELLMVRGKLDTLIVDLEEKRQKNKVNDFEREVDALYSDILQVSQHLREVIDKE